MTAPSAWRPLSEAPKDKRVVVDDLGDPRIAEWNEYWNNWEAESCEGRYRLNNTQCYLPLVADTLELDRAVQSEIARAFGELIQAIQDGEDCFSMWWTDEIAGHHRDQIHKDAIRKVATILHAAMGGRIPDEVP